MEQQLAQIELEEDLHQQQQEVLDKKKNLSEAVAEVQGGASASGKDGVSEKKSLDFLREEYTAVEEELQELQAADGGDDAADAKVQELTQKKAQLEIILGEGMHSSRPRILRPHMHNDSPVC